MELRLILSVTSFHGWMFLITIMIPEKMYQISAAPESHKDTSIVKSCDDLMPMKLVKDSPVPGMVDQTTIRSRCINDGKDMELTWRRPEKSQLVEYYVIETAFQQNLTLSRCLQHSSLEPIFVFNNMSLNDAFFSHGIDFYIKVHAYPLTPNITSDFQNVGGCPISGKWSGWDMWSKCVCSEECEVNQTMCVGYKHRTRTCRKIGDEEKETDAVNCREDSGRSYDRGYCATDCVEQTKKTENDAEGDDGDGDGSGNLIIIILLIILISTLILAVLIYFKLHSKKKGRIPETLPLTKQQPTVYISYSASNETQEMAILKLANGLNKYGIRVIMDLLNTVEINSMGGLSNWLPDNISSADKVIVLLSKEYIKALRTDEGTLEEEIPDEVCKIHAEYKLINTILYQNCQKSQKIALVIGDGVRKDDIPPVFRTMHHCAYPSKFNDKSDAFTQLLGILLDTEPIQMESAQIVEVSGKTETAETIF